MKSTKWTRAIGCGNLEEWRKMRGISVKVEEMKGKERRKERRKEGEEEGEEEGEDED